MTHSIKSAALAGAALACFAAPAFAQTSPTVEDLQRRIEALSKDLAELKAKEAARTTVSLPNGKPAIAAADGKFTANLRAIVMLDAGKYLQEEGLGASVVGRDLNSGTNFRRARIGLDGRVFSDFDYSFIYEFGGSGAEDPGRLYEAAVTYTALKPYRLKAGAFEPNVGLAAATSTSQMPLMERPAPAEAARNVAAGDSRLGFQVSRAGEFGKSAHWLAVGGLTGATISTISSSGSATAQAADEQLAWIGRFAVAPYAKDGWTGHLAINGQYVSQPSDAGSAATPRYPIQLRDRPELRLDGVRLVDTGAIDAASANVLGLEGGFQNGPLTIEAEAFRYGVERRNSSLADPHFNGWYVQGSWVLTGEKRVYNAAEGRFDAAKGKTVLNPHAKTWGMVELAARYSDLDLNFRSGDSGAATPTGGVRGGQQQIVSVGVNWYLNPSMRMMLDYQHVDVQRDNSAGVAIGQTYDAVAGRAQFAF